jgi:hypothetical protein
MIRSLLVILLAAMVAVTSARTDQGAGNNWEGRTDHLKDFQVIEFRRYVIKEGARAQFASYFESYFPEAFQQMGAFIFGQLLNRRNPAEFVWIRGFHNMDDRAKLNQAFYSGPLWKEHSSKMNVRMIDIANVLLLKPLTPERGIVVLPAVDPVREEKGAQGVVVAQIFAVKGGDVDAFAQNAEKTFAGYRDAGAREAGVLVTLDAPNNFPGLPFRTDGPYLVWLGIFKDNLMLEKSFNPLAERASIALSSTNLLRGSPELIVLDPSNRSRLRWLP